MLWLVVALLFQGFATQTHAHVSGDQAFTAAALTNAATVAANGEKDGPAIPACLLCQEKALFGAYLAGGSTTIAAPVEAAYTPATAVLLLLAFSATSHSWRSRAPPLSTT